MGWPSRGISRVRVSVLPLTQDGVNIHSFNKRVLSNSYLPRYPRCCDIAEAETGQVLLSRSLSWWNTEKVKGREIDKETHVIKINKYKHVSDKYHIKIFFKKK